MWPTRGQVWRQHWRGVASALAQLMRRAHRPSRTGLACSAVYCTHVCCSAAFTKEKVPPPILVPHPPRLNQTDLMCACDCTPSQAGSWTRRASWARNATANGSSSRPAKVRACCFVDCTPLHKVTQLFACYSPCAVPAAGFTRASVLVLNPPLSASTLLPSTGPPPGPAWGVTALPPGMDESDMDPKLLAIMRAQQGR